MLNLICVRSDTWKTTFSGRFLLILIVSIVRRRTAIYIANKWFWEGFSKQRVTSKQQLLEHDHLHRINLQKARVAPLQVRVLPGVQWVLKSITPDALVNFSGDKDGSAQKWPFLTVRGMACNEGCFVPSLDQFSSLKILKVGFFYYLGK